MPSRPKKYSLAFLFFVFFAIIIAFNLALVCFFIFREDERLMKEAIMFIALSGGLSFLVVFLAFFRLVINPISRLTNICNEIKRGNLNAKIEISSRTEIGELSSALSEMLEELKKSRANLEEAKSVLEIKVIARTQELSELIEQQEKIITQKTKDLEEKIKAVSQAKAIAEEEKATTTAVISNLVDGLLVFDKNDRLSFINPRAQALFNIRPKEIIGKTIDGLKNVRQFSSLYKLLEKPLELLLQKEIEIDGTLTADISIVPMIKDLHKTSSATLDNEKIGTLVIIRDISREKLVEKMKTEFVSLTAHQLRTPLSAIKWALRMLLDRDVGKINKEQEEFLERIFRSNERMIHLINDLLNVARIEEGKFLYQLAPVQLEELTAQTANSFSEKIKKKSLKLKINQPKDKLPPIKVDIEKIGIVIFNLLDNAIDYTPEKGKIEISLSADREKINFSIQDNGIGIPSDQQKRIFTKFFRGENVIKMETEGTGLGMFIAKNIIDAHHGKIWFESPEKRGTIFYFTLPIKD